MDKKTCTNWKDRIVSPEEVLKRIEPGMSIFIGTGGRTEDAGQESDGLGGRQSP